MQSGQDSRTKHGRGDWRQTLLVSLLISLQMAGATEPAVEDRNNSSASLVHDEARILPETQREALAAELRKFRETTSCSMHVMTATFVSGESIRDKANELADAWMPGEIGVVLAYDRSNSSHAIAPTEQLWRKYPTPGLVEAFREGATILQDATIPLDERLVRGARVLMKRIGALDRQMRLQSQVLVPGRERWLGVAFLGALILGAAAMAATVAFVRRREAARAVRFFFPEVETEPCFGAPYGGGVIAEIRFSKR